MIPPLFYYICDMTYRGESFKSVFLSCSSFIFLRVKITFTPFFFDLTDFRTPNYTFTPLTTQNPHKSHQKNVFSGNTPTNNLSNNPKFAVILLFLGISWRIHRISHNSSFSDSCNVYRPHICIFTISFSPWLLSSLSFFVLDDSNLALGNCKRAHSARGGT